MRCNIVALWWNIAVNDTWWASLWPSSRVRMLSDLGWEHLPTRLLKWRRLYEHSINSLYQDFGTYFRGIFISKYFGLGTIFAHSAISKLTCLYGSWVHLLAPTYLLQIMTLCWEWLGRYSVYHVSWSLTGYLSRWDHSIKFCTCDVLVDWFCACRCKTNINRENRLFKPRRYFRSALMRDLEPLNYRCLWMSFVRGI